MTKLFTQSGLFVRIHTCIACVCLLCNTAIAAEITVENNEVSGISVGDGDIYKVKTNGIISSSSVENGGGVYLTNSSTANDVTVNSGGIFSASGTSATVNNLIVNQGGSYKLSTNLPSVTAKIATADGSFIDAVISGKVAENFYIGYGSELTLTSGSTANNTVVDGGALVASNTKHTINGLVVNSGTVTTGSSTASIQKNTNFTINGGTVTFNGGEIDTIEVNTSGTLNASDTNLTDFSANSGSIINIDSASILKGDIKIDKNADFSGSTYDFSTLASTSGFSSLTLSGGVNDVFNNNLDVGNGSRSLYFTDGEYTVSNYLSGVIDGVDVTKTGVWGEIFLSNSTVSLKDEFVAQDVSIDETSILNLAANTTNASVLSRVYNDGNIDLTTSGAISELYISGDYVAGPNAQLSLKVDPTSGSADKLFVDGDVVGQTKLFLKMTSEDASDGNIAIVEAPNNTTGDQSSFSVWRKEGSLLSWDTLFEHNVWYVYSEQPGSGSGGGGGGSSPISKYSVVPEAAAYYGLIDNTFIQTSSLAEGLRNNIAENKFEKVPCLNGWATCTSDWPVLSGWLTPVIRSVSVEKPYVYDATIGGLDGGLDLVSNGTTKLGLLASYRYGKYSYEQDGEQYKFTGKAETDINSYLAGGYLRHDANNWSLILAAYAGFLDVDISTSDGVSASTTGITYGATLDVGYIYENIYGIDVEPGVRIGYTGINLDDIEDNAGRGQEFDKANRFEVEAGLKLTKRWELPDRMVEVYVKPAVVHIMDDTSEFALTETASLDEAPDRTVGKISAGVSFEINSSFSFSLSGSYSAGGNYTNASGNLNFTYSF